MMETLPNITFAWCRFAACWRKENALSCSVLANVSSIAVAACLMFIVALDG